MNMNMNLFFIIILYGISIQLCMTSSYCNLKSRVKDSLIPKRNFIIQSVSKTKLYCSSKYLRLDNDKIPINFNIKNIKNTLTLSSFSKVIQQITTRFDNMHYDLSQYSLIWLYIITSISMIYNSGLNSLKIFTLHSLEFYLLSTIIKILNSASKRNRLDGSTFKRLNLSLLCTTMWIVVAMARNISPNLSIFSISESIFSCVTMYSSIRAIQKFGLPKINFLYSSKLSSLCFLASTFSILKVIQHTFIRITINSAFNYEQYISGLSEMILIPFIFLVLNGASSVGPKRLSSETYQQLSKATSIYSLLQLLINFKANAISISLYMLTFIVSSLCYLEGNNYLIVNNENQLVTDK